MLVHPQASAVAARESARGRVVEMSTAADFATLDALLDGRAKVDAVCVWCGPVRSTAVKQRRKVLRLWGAPGFISFHCARCGESGYVRENERRPVDRETLQRARATIVERERIDVERKRRKALALWRKRRPIIGALAETYLREARGITCALPATLGFLPAHGEHPPAMIAAFGLPDEPEPGVLAIADEAVRGIHLTKLRSDGSGKAYTEPNKIMVGRSLGAPIVLAPMNDALGLAITEGLEDALSMHSATGLGARAAGAASRMPALADAVPDFTDCVSIFADTDADETGQRNAAELAERLNKRGIHADVVPSGAMP